MQQNKSLIIGGLVVVLGLAGFGLWQRTTPSSPEPSITASQTVDRVEYACNSGQTALAALAEHHQITTKDTDFGRQVMGIDQRLVSEREFWAFYVNNTSATVGADSYACQENDQIKWQIETF